MKVKIKDIAQVINGATPSSTNKEYYGGNIVWITPNDLSKQQSKYISCGERNITKLGFDSCSTKLIPANNILMSSRAPIGLISINTIECCTNQGFKSLIVDKEKCDVEYLYYYLKFHIKEIEALGSGTTFKELSKESFKKYEIELPDIKIQKSIAETLMKLDNKIILNNKINSKLEAMAKTLYDYWFLQFEFPNEEGKPYRSSGGKMVCNEELKREIPEGWEITNIGNITICHDSKRIPVSGNERENMKGEIPYYGATGIMGYVDKPIFNGDYVLVAEDGSIMDENGNPILQRISGKTWVNNHAHVLEPIKGFTCKLLMMCLKDIPVAMIKTGSIQMKINQENLNKIPVLNIPKPLKEKINVYLSVIDKKILELQKENQELTELRDFLLPLLMSGQVGFKEN